MLYHSLKLATLRGFIARHQKVLKGFLGAVMACAIFGTQSGTPAAAQTNDQEVTMSKPQDTLNTTQGDIVIDLNAEKAPNTDENFLNYVKVGVYDWLVLHRVIGGYMIHGGGFQPRLKQKQSNAPIENEADNGLQATRYARAIARTTYRDSGTAQCFINVAYYAFLH